MRPLIINQMFHGYQRGHEVLASSIRLTTSDSEMVTSLSDLSGTLLSGFSFSSYLTLYPLTSSGVYAVALTRPDPNVSRAGCVLTHTLLVKLDDWKSLQEPRRLDSLFDYSPVAPRGQIRPIDYLPTSPSMKTRDLGISSQELDFVGRYFGEGIRPIVWTDAPSPDETLWSIVSGLWPAHRCSFSSCSLCLQPRFLKKRPFDVMFCPSIANSRFSRIGGEHFVGRAPLPSEPWQQTFAAELFLGASPNPNEEAVKSALDDSPNSIKKVFLFQELWERSDRKPTAAIGVFDLLESLHAPEMTFELQRTALNRAFLSFDSLNPTERLELFSMLMLRVARVRIPGQADQIILNDLVGNLMRSLIPLYPDSVLSEIDRVWGTLGDDDRFRSVFMKNLATALDEDPSLSASLAAHPNLGRELLATWPGDFARVLNQPSAALLREYTVEWLHDASFRIQMRKIFVPFLAQLKVNNDISLIRKTLSDISEVEAASFLSVLADEDGPSFANHELKEAVIDTIARSFPEETREWIYSNKRTDESAAEVASSTYPPNPSEYLSILATKGWGLSFSRLILAIWIGRNSARNSRFVNGITDLAKHDAAILESLVAVDCKPASDKALQILLESLTWAPMLSQTVLREIIESNLIDRRLVDLVIRSTAYEYVRNGNSLESLDLLFRSARTSLWFDNTNCGRLAWVIQGAISDECSCQRGWNAISRLPDEAFHSGSIVRVIDVLIQPTKRVANWEALNTWIGIIRRAQVSSLSLEQQAELFGQAVRFAFENPRLPASALVVEGFMPLYTFVVESNRIPSSAGGLFSAWNWDKGSELREGLADAFTKGVWPPGDLSHAVPDITLLKKILKRISRRWSGQEFIRRMYSDLASRNDNNSHRLASLVADLLKSGDYGDEWD